MPAAVGRILCFDRVDSVGVGGNLGTERVIYQAPFNFDDLDEPNVKFAAGFSWTHNGTDSNINTVRIRVGGGYLTADGTVVASIALDCSLDNPANNYAIKLVGTIARPSGAQWIKLTNIGHSSQSAESIARFACFVLGVPA